jgi:MoaA/NifB/PqqE/SkfB family radical SAM enzyme
MRIIKKLLEHIRRKWHGDLYSRIDSRQNADVVSDLSNVLLKTIPRATLTTIDIPVVEHCNLNCVGCDHCSPIAKAYFLEPGVFEKDMERLAGLTGGMIGIIRILGGEPLLHPELCSFMKTSRMFFTNSRIDLVTNAVLLEKQPDVFWETCRRNAVGIIATKYPVNIRWEKIEQKAEKEHVRFGFFSSHETEKTSYHIPFDITGMQDTVKSFVHCFHANDCHELVNGRIYACSVAPHVKHFNAFFEENMELSDKDSIDIYKVKDMREILDFLARPIPFCRYCDVKGRTFGNKWSISKKAITEWT